MSVPVLKDLPTWVRSVAWVGFPVMVAGYFMAKDAGWIPYPLGVIQEAIAGHVEQDREVIRLLREQCLTLKALAKGEPGGCLSRQDP